MGRKLLEQKAKIDPERLYSPREFEKRQKALDQQRAEFMDRYPGLDPKIKAAFQK